MVQRYKKGVQKQGTGRKKNKQIASTGQVLKDMARFVACGDVCRYKLEK